MILLRSIWWRLVFVLGWLGSLSWAYVPAQPTNDSAQVQAGVNESDTSMLNLQWYPNASFSQTVSYQLVGAGSNGQSKGALVHFSEQNDTDTTTTTPWIAFISCDTNGTEFSLEDDVFTLARDRGAVAALLFSEWSDACIINSEYADPSTFDQVFDIFSTKSLVTARTVENAFTNINETLYYYYNGTTLNDSFSSINDTISSGIADQGFLFATLTAYNSTASDSSSGSSSGSTTSNSSGSEGTDLAMVVLYVISGAVSVLFCIVILSGAIRAMRHPERYGPRPADPTMGDYQGQTRARGLTRAILDTFPVIKFSRMPVTGRDFGAQNMGMGYPKHADAESGSEHESTYGGALEMGQFSPNRSSVREMKDVGKETEVATTRDAPPTITLPNIYPRRSDEAATSPGAGPSSSPLATPTGEGAAVVGSRNLRPTAEDGAEPSRVDSEVLPDSIGRDTCPICIVDFEEGDDLRILPCEGKHVFHQACVDQWLLELSSSCPLCRHDFIALEEMIAGSVTHEGGEDSTNEHPSTTTSTSTSTSEAETHRASQSQSQSQSQSPTGRFSRYLRFARVHRDRNRQQRQPAHHRRPWGDRDDTHDDPTDPPYPVVHDSHI